MMKIPIEDLRIRVATQFRRAGSVLSGTATAGCDQVRIEVQLKSDAPSDRLAELIRVADASCYVAGALREPVPCELAATVNGQPLELG